MFLKIVLVFLSFCAINHGDEILCTDDFCKKYTCSNLIPDECNIQNATHSGIFLPFPGPCNCCSYCLKNLGIDEDCTIGEPNTPSSDSVCGDLLFCHSDDADITQGTCTTMAETSCTKQQQEYDDALETGELGHLVVREECNRRGNYSHYKCIPGEICYCVSEFGERLFGEIPFTTLAEHLMNCECSRNHKTMSQFFGRDLHVGEYFRCQSNGDYDPIQCIADDECLCVDAVDGVQTFPKLPTINVTEISNDTMPCFNNDVHVEGEYYRPCEEEYLDLLEMIDEFEDDGLEVIGLVYPNCQLDGRYGPVQSNDTHYYCSDPDGNVLEDFIVDKDEDALVQSMNCACARSRGVTIIDKPTCLTNGNYAPIQCRRGFCRCVDENGNQIKKEVPVNDLETYVCEDVFVPVMGKI